MKRILSIVLAGMMLMMAVPANAYSTDSYKNGDVTHNGRLDIADATTIQKHIVELVDFDSDTKKLADFNCDGAINIFDATLIQEVIAEMAPMPEEPTKPDEKQSSSVNIAFTNSKNWSNVYFYFYNSVTGAQSAEWPGQRMTDYDVNGYGEQVYYSTVDVSKYDRVIFNNSKSQTLNVPLSKASSGFYISDSTTKSKMQVGIYALKGADSGNLTRTYLKYPSGYSKKIWVWTPADYDASSAKKYKTIYVMDGQNLFDEDHTDGFGGWGVTNAVESMMANGGRGVIIVGIDNSSGHRDSELTPDIGNVLPEHLGDFSNRTGIQFSDFVVNTVMPYVQSNYNSSTLAEDNCIAGSSSGGLESFYIGLEHRDKFGMIGSLSPAFLLFGSDVWKYYLSKYDFTADDMPRLYISIGNGYFESELYPDTISMYNRLVGYGYNTDKLKLTVEENYEHNEAYWRALFPEMLAWCLDI